MSYIHQDIDLSGISNKQKGQKWSAANSNLLVSGVEEAQDNIKALDLALCADPNIVIGQNDYETGYYNANGVFVSSNTVHHALVDIKKFVGYYISVTPTTSQYALVSSIGEDSITFCSGCSRESGTPTNLYVPTDCKYLYLYIASSTSYDRTIASTMVKGLSLEIDEVKTEVNTINGEVKSLSTLSDVASNYSTAYEVDKTNEETAILSTPIVLQRNGDSFEFHVVDVSDCVTNSNYAFAFTGSNTNSTCIGIGDDSSSRKFSFRADDATWIFYSEEKAIGHTYKISYENNNIILYVDGVLKDTYTGQKTATIGGFGIYNGLYWNGKFCGVKVNGVEYDIEVHSSTFDFTTSLYGTSLTKEEQEEIKLGLPKPDVVVNKEGTNLDVHVNINDVDFLTVRLQNKTSETLFYDVWQIYQVFASTLNDGEITIGDTLFASGVSELAISVTSQGGVSGYVGGTHGRDMIAVDDNDERQVLMLIDGLPLSETGTTIMTPCSKFDVYTHEYLYEPATTEDPWAEVMKHWEFSKGQVKISTTLKTINAIEIAHGQFGMMCIFRRWEGDSENDYMTSRAFKSNLPFKVYNIEDGWDVGHTENTPLKRNDHDCTQLYMWGDMGYGVTFETPNDNRKEGGGIHVATNGGTYNKVYFDLTGTYSASANETLYGTQIWKWKKTNVE